MRIVSVLSIAVVACFVVAAHAEDAKPATEPKAGTQVAARFKWFLSHQRPAGK